MVNVILEAHTEAKAHALPLQVNPANITRNKQVTNHLYFNLYQLVCLKIVVFLKNIRKTKKDKLYTLLYTSYVLLKTTDQAISDIGYVYKQPNNLLVYVMKIQRREVTSRVYPSCRRSLKKLTGPGPVLVGS